MLFDKFENKTVIKGKLIAVDPIHIGSSEKNSLNPTEIDDSVLKDSKGNAVIPGSSLKGISRMYLESVLRALYDGNEGACYVLDNEGYCTKEIMEKIKKNPREVSKNNSEKIPLKEKAELIYENSCKMCRLFGGRDFAGKVHFKDSYSTDKVIFEKRDGVGIDRETGAAKTGAKYDFEIVPKDTKFDFYLVAENLEEEQKKIFNLLIDYLKSGEATVGGKTTRGLGRIKLVDVEEEYTDKEALKQQLMGL